MATVFQCRVTKQPNFEADLKHDLYNMVHSRLDRMPKIRYPVGFAAQVFAVPSRFGEAFSMSLRQVTHTHDSSGNIATSPLDSDIGEVSQSLLC